MLNIFQTIDRDFAVIYKIKFVGIIMEAYGRCTAGCWQKCAMRHKTTLSAER